MDRDDRTANGNRIPYSYNRNRNSRSDYGTEVVRKQRRRNPMTEAQDYKERRWLALGLLCVAQFIVVLDASIVNVALPSIGEALNFSESNLSWIVNAYVLTFGGFLLLGGRMADLLGRRRVFIAGLLLVAFASLSRRLRLQRGPADRGARRSGPRRGDRLSVGALDRHHHLQRRRRAQQGARGLGRRRRLRRRGRRPPRRHPHRRPRLGVGALGERSGWPDCRLPRAAVDRREPRRVRDPLLRHRRRGQRHRRPLDPGLRAGRRQRRRLGLDPDARPARRRGGAARGVRRDRAPARRSRWCRSGSSG